MKIDDLLLSISIDLFGCEETYFKRVAGRTNEGKLCFNLRRYLLKHNYRITQILFKNRVKSMK